VEQEFDKEAGLFVFGNQYLREFNMPLVLFFLILTDGLLRTDIHEE
jgi:hypothetical protein